MAQLQLPEGRAAPSPIGRAGPAPAPPLPRRPGRRVPGLCAPEAGYPVSSPPADTLHGGLAGVPYATAGPEAQRPELQLGGSGGAAPSGGGEPAPGDGEVGELPRTPGSPRPGCGASGRVPRRSAGDGERSGTMRSRLPSLTRHPSAGGRPLAVLLEHLPAQAAKPPLPGPSDDHRRASRQPLGPMRCHPCASQLCLAACL